MSDASKLSIVPLAPIRPASRTPDPRDQIIANQHKLAQVADQQFANWEFWGQHVSTALALAVALADAGRWEELRDYLRVVNEQAGQMAKSRTRTASLPDDYGG